MKKNSFFIPSLILVLTCCILPVKASHLDGLWRSDRSQITLRIEQDQHGFRAKRTDQGIWYHYSTEDHQHFIDKYGNWYELVDDEELVWNEANSGKRIYFFRVDERNDAYWGNRGNDYNPYGNKYDNRWQEDRYRNGRNSIDGNWFDRNGRTDIQIISFPGGIRVKTNQDGWEKYYADRSGNRFKDKHGNTIILIDRENLRYRSQYGKHELIFTRRANWKRYGNHWRD